MLHRAFISRIVSLCNSHEIQPHYVKGLRCSPPFHPLRVFARFLLPFRFWTMYRCIRGYTFARISSPLSTFSPCLHPATFLRPFWTTAATGSGSRWSFGLIPRFKTFANKAHCAGNEIIHRARCEQAGASLLAFSFHPVNYTFSRIYRRDSCARTSDVERPWKSTIHCLRRGEVQRSLCRMRNVNLATDY